MRCSLTFLTLTIAALITLPLHAQVGVGANFGIEADCYSGDATSGAGTDDWYLGTSGSGVIDEATALAMGYAAQLAAGNNIEFDLRQSLPNYSENNGYLWYSARYGRDYVNLSSQDLTTFAGGKNGDNPTTQWGTAPGSLPSKTDIVDAAVHMRRNGTLTTDDLWVDLVISTLDNSGNHFVDFELFVSELQQTGPGFTNSGTQEGHTAWEFDAGGNVTQIGDMIVGFAFSGGGVSGVDVRLWVRRSVFNPGTSPGGTSTFTWGSNISGGSTYGYGQIVIPVGSILSHVNTVNVAAPPWGTTDTSGYTGTYNPGNLAEVALNFRALGFDPELLFGPGSACDSPFSAVLTKSRTSSAFTSTLKDFSGPYDFLGSSAFGQVNTTIIDPGDFDSCATGETFTLEAEFKSVVAEYIWYSLTPGVVFPANGLSEISGVNMTTVTIDTPGDYQLGIAPLPGCTPVTDPDDILPVDAVPCAVDDSFTVLENSLSTDPDNTLGVLTNDTDLENDLDPSSLNNSGLLQPSNGTVSIVAGVLTYQPDTDYVGTDSFEYQICDSSNPALCDIALVIVQVSADTDGEGVSDNTDLDDDNDGIPDMDEFGGVNPNADHDSDGTANYRDGDFCTLNGFGICSAWDNDGDGISNHLDLDSDNDGIYDAEEAGHGLGYTAGAISGPYGANGLADTIETVAESGIINYAIRNTDGTDLPDYLDSDSDNDGCVDANEAYASANADSDSNGYYGSGSPPAVNGDGTVAAASYALPADQDSNSTYDYREDTAPTITVQPVDTSACPGCNATFTVAGTNLDTFQWQLFDGVSWNDLTDTGIYSGTQTNTLLLTSVTNAENGNQYRVLIDDQAFVCGPVVSNIAILNVQVNTVITNRRITYRVNKD